MTEMNSIWERSNKLLLVVNFRSLGEMKAYREAIKSVGLNVHNCHILAIVEDKREKQMLTELGSVTYISDKEFNLLGKLKNEEAQKTLRDSFDLMVVVDDIPKRIRKLLSKRKNTIGVGINNEIDFLTIKLNSEQSEPLHLITFVQDTLKKIT